MDYLSCLLSDRAASGLSVRALAGEPSVSAICRISTRYVAGIRRGDADVRRPSRSEPRIRASADGNLRSAHAYIGLPFLLLASTSPLLQVWLAREKRGDVPWRLFALSNADHF